MYVFDLNAHIYVLYTINRHAFTKAMVFKLGELVNLNEYSHCVTKIWR